MTNRVTKAIIYEDGAATLMARIESDEGANIVQDDLASITCKVFDTEDPTTPTTPTITIADAISDTLRTGAPWTVDTIGYNFKAKLAGSNWPLGNRIYQAEIIFTPDEGDPYPVVFELKTRELYSS